MKNKTISRSSFLLVAVVFIITDPFFSILHRGYFRKFEPALLVPLFYTGLAYLVASSILLLFSEKIFKLWLRRIVIWFLPLSVLLVWGGGNGNEYASFGATETAILMGFVLVAITTVFALMQRFYYKNK